MSWRVWNDNGASGKPGTQLLSDTVLTPPYAAWFYIAVAPPVPIDSGYVYVGWSDDMMSGGALAIYNGYDSALNWYNWWYNGSAWVLDDFFTGDFMVRAIVEIGGIPNAHDVGTVSIDLPATLPLDTTLTPQTTVKNFGDSIETFDVTCIIDPGGYTSTFNVVDLPLAESVQVTFPDSFTFVSGFYTVTVYTQLGTDDNLANDTLVMVVEATGIAEGGAVVPKEFVFKAPTICKGRFNIEFSLPAATRVDLSVYDALGRLSRTLISERFTAGTHRLNANLDLATGVYFYNLKTELGAVTKKFLIVE